MNILRITRSILFRCSMAVLILLLSGCAKDQDPVNQKPVLNISPVSDGLLLTLKGSAADPDGTISGVTIDWGDNKHDQLSGNGVADINVSHLYAEPATCQIIITALDDAGETTALAVPVSPAFKETSLAGVKPGMFKASENEFLVFTLNLHTYQESRQNEKLNMIADVIGKMNVDFICFQECAQNKYSAITGGIIREDNMALVISQRIREKYQVTYDFAWNWSHYGWEVWEEGVAVLSRHPVIQSEDRYVSTNTGTGSITSRKVIYASCQAPGGLFNIFSAHTHWRTSLTDEEQNRQVENIQLMVSEKEAITPDAFSIVCGDFNGNPTSDYPWSEGYNTMMRPSGYSDSFLEVHPDANQTPAQSIYNTVGGSLPGRIDYIFVKKNPRIRVADSQIIFTNEVVGTVSDHFGVLTKIILP